MSDVSPHVTTITRDPDDPDHRYRVICGERLADAMEAVGVNRKELARRLGDHGNEVTIQAVGHWITGNRLPRPSMQVAIARALGVRARSIFDIEQAA